MCFSKVQLIPTELPSPLIPGASQTTSVTVGCMKDSQNSVNAVKLMVVVYYKESLTD